MSSTQSLINDVHTPSAPSFPSTTRTPIRSTLLDLVQSLLASGSPNETALISEAHGLLADGRVVLTGTFRHYDWRRTPSS